MVDKVIVKETNNKVIVSTPGPQGPRGNTILNGAGAPANNLGIQNDFYIDNVTTRFYGPKPSDTSWVGAPSFILAAAATVPDHRHTYNGEIDENYVPN
jgi:hypothetical protein